MAARCLRDERDAVRREQLPDLRRSEPGLARVPESRAHERFGGGTVDPVELRDSPDRPAEPLGAFDDPAESSGCRLRVRERCHAALPNECRRRSLVADEDAENRLLAHGRGLHSTKHRRRDVFGIRDDGRDEEHDDRVDARIANDVGEDRFERLGGRRAEHVHRVGEARLRREHRLQRVAGRVGKWGQLEAGGLARVGGQDPEPTGVREQRHAASLRKRLRREQSGHVDELLEGVGADHAGLVEEGLDCGLGSRERRGVGSGGAGTGPRSPSLHREDRLLARDAPGELRELAWVPERLQVESDDCRRRIVLPVLEEVVRRDVGLVPDRDERRQADPA